MKSRRSAGLLLALVLAAPAAAQQDPKPDPLYTLDPKSRVAIEALVDSAAAQGLPTRTLLSRAVLGVQRRVDGPTIVRVVRALYGDLRQSRAIFGGTADAAVIDAGAAVLSAGVKPNELAEFAATPIPSGRSPAAALVYLADLVSNRDVPRDQAASEFLKLWRSGASDADFDGLWRSVGQDILSGVNPGTALSNRAREFPSRATPPPRPPDFPSS